MSEHTTTQCVLFPGIFERPVFIQFDQPESSSDGGAILLKAADRRLGLTEALAACLEDERQAAKVDHEVDELLMQRVMAIACGYADGNDAARLASDPVHKLLVGRDPKKGGIWLRNLPFHVLKTAWTARSYIVWGRCWPTW